jgi:hypothetical protein
VHTSTVTVTGVRNSPDESTLDGTAKGYPYGSNTSVTTGTVSFSGSQPYINWITAGNAQQRYQAQIFNSGGTMIYNSGDVLSAATAFYGPSLSSGTYTWKVSACGASTYGCSWTPWASGSFVYAASYTLSVTKSDDGLGTVTSNPAGINYGTDNTENYIAGTVVTLTATPDTGYTFATWGGACAAAGSANTCMLTMDAAKSVNASFVCAPKIMSLSASPLSVIQNSTMNVTITSACGNSYILQDSWSKSGPISSLTPGTVTVATTPNLTILGNHTLSVGVVNNARGTVWSSINYTVVAPVVHSCLNADPTNATLCPYDNIGLTEDTYKTVVDICSEPKCEYYCPPPYTYSGGSCACLTTYSETGCSVPCGGGTKTITLIDCYGNSYPNDQTCNNNACPSTASFKPGTWKEVAP